MTVDPWPWRLCCRDEDRVDRHWDRTVVRPFERMMDRLRAEWAVRQARAAAVGPVVDVQHRILGGGLVEERRSVDGVLTHVHRFLVGPATPVARPAARVRGVRTA